MSACCCGQLCKHLTALLLQGTTLLHSALLCHWPNVKLLLSKGADINAKANDVSYPGFDCQCVYSPGVQQQRCACIAEYLPMMFATQLIADVLMSGQAAAT